MSINESNINRYSIYSDGGARGNPGPAGTGWLVFAHTPDAEIILKKCGNYLGTATNNQAEYRALFEALDWAVANIGKKPLNIYLDSELIVKQLNGLYKVKNQDLKPWFLKVKHHLSAFPSAQIKHVPREQNSAADALVNQAIDQRGRVEV